MTRRGTWGLSSSTLRAKVLISINGMAVRRAVLVVVMACLVAGPFGSALAAHHVADADRAGEKLSATAASKAAAFDAEASSINASIPAVETKASGKLYDPVQPEPVADHDCHGCSMVAPHAPAGSLALFLRSTPELGPAYLNAGRSVPAEIRPPRA